ncbi:hypothetical protein ROE7235_03095 [Roseibaca ekhonensis]|uniref:Uncharacterized protein n=1 Tax=Roseinatronobacter ekhonensis TaxID=254356 RepID=A0A3B0MZW5_9RHOB|nr:hypothetical protein [Roseibaca ekhonensis]SUZ33326.1 hypothetical protein ROE7235_03095 [Roseibaca ekhonensis]
MQTTGPHHTKRPTPHNPLKKRPYPCSSKIGRPLPVCADISVNAQPQTRARVEEIDSAAKTAYAAFLQSRRDSGDWPGAIPVEAGATYLGEQIALAITQRAAGEDRARIREMLGLAFSVFFRP